LKILVTGTAGFIGSFLAKSLLSRNDTVVGIDSINDYYDVRVKYGRLEDAGIHMEGRKYGQEVVSRTYPNYRFIQQNLEDREKLHGLMQNEKFDVVVNLAAQAGVRYSLTNPYAYMDANILGFINILEGCRQFNVKNLVYASSSSIYGLNETLPFSVHHNVDHPISLYAASKKSNELMAHTYSHLFGISTTGLRFFTVYGPWSRPDMALFLFTKAIFEERPINVFNNGDMVRDFTYIDDIVTGVIHCIDKPAKSNPDWDGKSPDPGTSTAPYKIYNIGNNSPVKLTEFISAIEKAVGKSAKKNYLPLQAGDLPATYADVADLMTDFGYKPATDIQTGINNFVSWYREFYNI